MGRVVALQYVSKGIADVLRVHLRTHVDTMDYHDLPNGDYVVQCPALQFMALHGFQPSDLDTFTNVEDVQLLIPIAPIADGWGLARAAMEGGEDALRDAEWFGGPDRGNHGGGGGGPHGGGGDGGGGAGARDDVDIDVEVERDESGDSGVKVSPS
jgi:uncharacterized membrane protein YgcG